MNTKKKLKEFANKAVRKIKHRKGYGVHSPFAFSVITEVIEEKTPYYAYRRMQTLYAKGTPVPFKVAALMFRLANRFKSRRILEIGCDGGYSLLPLLLVDRRNEVTSLAAQSQIQVTRQHLSLFRGAAERVAFVESLDSLPADYVADMIVVNSIPAGWTPADFVAWLQQHLHERGLLFAHGIQSGNPLEAYWDEVCECDQIEVTMDLYNYGLAIRQPHFFKQHYVVSF